MEWDAISPELRGPARRVPALPLDRGWARWLARFAGRLIPATRTPGVGIEERRVGRRRVRLYRPAAPRTDAALLWFHGGGYVIGSPRQDDRLCGQTSAALGMVVVSASYRLAPDHPFPAAGDDAHAAWAWLQRHSAELGVDPGRVVIGGQSAGGGLAAGLVQRLRDEGGVQPIGQWLFAPMLDDRTAADRSLDGVGHRVWNNRLNGIAWRALLGREPGGPDLLPYAAPARTAALGGLPPAWIGVGAVDLFIDEDRAYAERLRAAGVEAALDVVGAAPHGFEAWAPDTGIARAYIDRARAWLAGRIGQGGAATSPA